MFAVQKLWECIEVVQMDERMKEQADKQWQNSRA